MGMNACLQMKCFSCIILLNALRKNVETEEGVRASFLLGFFIYVFRLLFFLLF